MSTNSDIFIYDGVEVKYTGRVAKRPSTLSANKVLEVREIVPVDPESIQFKKWVKPEDLFVVDLTTGDSNE
jgi:hypothetical protein